MPLATHSTNEENPFIYEEVSKEWITAVEGERGLWRDIVLYPKLQDWMDSLKGCDVLLDVGSGQGRLSSEISGYVRYIGIEPSPFLLQRAKERYSAENRTFMYGDAYNIPLGNESVDAVVCVNVLLHIKNAERALREMVRVLKLGGSFFIVTADNDSLELWKSFFLDPIIDDEKMKGKMILPVHHLSLNTLYFQPNDAISNMLETCGLHIHHSEKMYEMNGYSAFILFRGQRI